MFEVGIVSDVVSVSERQSDLGIGWPGILVLTTKCHEKLVSAFLIVSLLVRECQLALRAKQS